MVIDAPPAIVEIAQRVKQQEHGIVLYRLHRIFDVHAGPMRRHDELELAVVTQDAHVVKVRVLRAVTGGKAMDEAGAKQVENQYEHPNPADVFHRPFDPAYVHEYTYQTVDATTYRFTSALRDGSHGDGTFSLDGAGNVVRYEYTPDALPRYATSGTVTNDRSQVLPGVWNLTREAHQYRGHYLLFGGGATALITYDSFQAYADIESALSALQSISPAPVPKSRVSISRPSSVSSSVRGSERRRSAPLASSACSSAMPSGPEI